MPKRPLLYRQSTALRNVPMAMLGISAVGLVLILLPLSGSSAFAQSAPAFPGACPTSAAPQNWRTIVFDNECSQTIGSIWVGALGQGVPPQMLVTPTSPGQKIPYRHPKTWCVPSPCPSCSFFAAVNCNLSDNPVTCDSGPGRLPPITVAEIAIGGSVVRPPPQGLTATSPHGAPISQLVNHFVGHGFIQPGSFSLIDDSGVLIAEDDGDGNVVNVGGSTGLDATKTNTINYLNGMFTVHFKAPLTNGDSDDRLYNFYTWLGDDTYDVSMVNGFNIPVQISIQGGGASAGPLSFSPQPCVATSDCQTGFTCSNSQCVKACSTDADCGQYPGECDKTTSTCVNALAETYLCTSPGCSTGQKSCAPQRACHWNFRSCPSFLQVKNNKGRTVGCLDPGDVCNGQGAFASGGVSTSGCTGGPGVQGSCPAGTVCNAATNGNCLPVEPCTGGPNLQGSCANASTICTAASNGICVDTFALPGGCTGGPDAQGSCPAGLTCSAASGGECECSGGPNARGNCPSGLICSANTSGLCVGCQGHCPDSSCFGQGVCADACSGTGQGNCPTGSVCSSSSGSCLAPINGFTDLDCLGTYDIACVGSDESCPAGTTCSSGQCVGPTCTTSATHCSTSLDCASLDGAEIYQCLGGACVGCPAGGFTVCDTGSNTCKPTNTGLFAAGGPAATSCQIKSGTYNACFSNQDCPPGTTCNLIADDPNQFTCIDSTSGPNGFSCTTSGQCPTPGFCGSTPVVADLDKCITGGQSCTTDANCPSGMLCDGSQCVWPPWCGGPLNTQWNSAASTYAKLFKAACPTAYSYQFDDPTSTFQCEQSAVSFNSSSNNTAKVASLGYKITFCPAQKRPRRQPKKHNRALLTTGSF
jgi:hypothetical protein